MLKLLLMEHDVTNITINMTVPLRFNSTSEIDFAFRAALLLRNVHIGNTTLNLSKNFFLTM